MQKSSGKATCSEEWKQKILTSRAEGKLDEFVSFLPTPTRGDQRDAK